jgi:M6 family metalloprotease-like protein
LRPSILLQGHRFVRFLMMPGATMVALVMVFFAGVLVDGALAFPGDHQPKGDRQYEDLPVFWRNWHDRAQEVGGLELTEREQARQGEYFRRWKEIHDLVGPAHVSRRSQDLLARRGLGRSLLEQGNAAKGYQPYDGQDTLKVLIVRFGFESNRDSNLTTVLPSGNFDLSTPPDDGRLRIDPAPRNRAFFEAHLEGLAEYYTFQSGNRLHIEGRVLPEGQDDCYRLSDPADYGPGEGGGWTLESLERLVRDMIIAADEETTADGSASLADYDDDNDFTYIIFVHAGSDWQSDINQDSPNDIPTFFVTLGEPQDLPASGGSLSECSIIPETTNQDGYPGSIAAAFYHEFGHALGLVDVYNTTTGLPSVGIWDLMDSGTNLPVWVGEEVDGEIVQVSATGVLPPSLGIWNKYFLGWIDKLEEIDGRSAPYNLPAVQVPRGLYPTWDAGSGDFNTDYPQAIKAGPSNREFFLLENRYVPLPDTTSTYMPYAPLFFKRDQETGVIQYLGGTRGGVDYNTGMYDFFLPAGGVLAWHVNNDVIAPNLETNTINAEGDGLRLLEADGIQDIGVLDSYVLGWYGSFRDPFGEESGFQHIYTDAFPSSRMFDRSWSGLSVSDIRQASHRTSSVMQLNAHISPLAEGYPYEIGQVSEAEAAAAGGSAGPRALDPRSMTPAVIAGQHLLFFADQPAPDWDGGDYPAALFALDADGDAAFNAGLANRPDEAFLDLGSPLAGPPLLFPNLYPSQPGLLWATQRGRVGTSVPQAGAAPTAWSVETGDSLLTGPVAMVSEAGVRIALGAYPDSLHVLGIDGSPSQDPLSLSNLFSLAPSRLIGPGLMQVFPEGTRLVAFLDQCLATFDLMSGAVLPGQYITYPAAPSGELRVAVVPLDDGETARSHIWVFDDNGCLGGYSVAVDGSLAPLGRLEVNQPLVCDPAVADVDGDGLNDVVLVTADKVYGYQGSMIPLRGFPTPLVDMFPLESGTTITGPLVLADADGNGTNEIFFNTSGGHLMGLSSSGRLLAETPFLWGDLRAAGLAVGAIDQISGKRNLFLLSQGGYSGELMNRLFYNGRIMAYELTAPDAETTQTSGWFGPLGGSRRSGVEGFATDLGEQAPLAAEMGKVITYPNPVSGDLFTLRFFSEVSGTARFELYNLEGELVSAQDFSVPSGRLFETEFNCSMAVSGVYMGRLLQPSANGTKIQTITLAVER